MPGYISTFPAGFGAFAQQDLPRRLRGASVRKVYDGLIHYEYAGGVKDIAKVGYLNNTFCVIQSFQGQHLSFDKMVQDAAKRRHQIPVATGSFRVRFSRENRFEPVSAQLARRAEAAALANSHLRIDRVNPTTEIWYLIRREGVGFYCQLVTKRAATEKTLHKGELRPELAYLLCCCAHLDKSCAVLDPFAGYGAIPAQILKGFPHAKLCISDLDRGLVEHLGKRFPGKPGITVLRQDATRLDQIPDGSIDAIITDPPWGLHEDVGDTRAFYTAALGAFARVLSAKGQIVLLTARKAEFEQAIASTPALRITGRIDTLVNGKKAGVYTLTRT